VKERILLVRHVRIEGHEASKIAEKELHKSRWCGAYKWLERFDEHGLEGLKDHSRSGVETSFIYTRKKMLKIRQESYLKTHLDGRPNK